MPKVLTNSNLSSENTPGSTVAENIFGDLELIGDVASFIPGISAVASVGSALAGTAKDITRFANGKLSGSTTLSNIGGHALWGAVGVIPGGKALKWLGKGKDALKVAENTNKATKTVAKGLREQAKATTKTTLESSKKGTKTLGRFAGRTAVAGGFTYGMPGVEQYIRENNSDYRNGEFILPSLQTLGGGAINGWNLMTTDIGNLALGDIAGAGSRLGSVFLLPHSYVNRKKLPKTPKPNNTSKTNTSKTAKPATPPLMIERKTSIDGPGFTVTTTGNVLKPATTFKKKFGGKLNNLKILRNENNT